MPDRPNFDPNRADASGLVAIGSDLKPATLLRAYRAGVFPWYDESMPICWWSPDPRAILPLDNLHISHRLARTMRSSAWSITINHDFGGVIRGCASERHDGTWLTPEMIAAYQRLHSAGHAHSLEVWHSGELAGGIYGVAVGGLFAGESMFHRRRDASKIALVRLVERLLSCNFVMLDIQFLTPHTARMGGTEIPRAEYLRRLAKALGTATVFC